MSNVVDLETEARNRQQQADDVLDDLPEFFDCSPAMQRALRVFMKEAFGAEADEDEAYVTFLPALRAAFAALKYEDGTDEAAVIRASAPLKVDAVTTIECFEAMIDEVLR